MNKLEQLMANLVEEGKISDEEGTVIVVCVEHVGNKFLNRTDNPEETVEEALDRIDTNYVLSLLLKEGEGQECPE